jgi:hypothetical protein
MNEYQGPASRGSVERSEVAQSHWGGFNAAFNRALHDLDGQKYAGQELQVNLSVTISANPGGVGQYHVTLGPPVP